MDWAVGETVHVNEIQRLLTGMRSRFSRIAQQDWRGYSQANINRYYHRMRLIESRG